MEQGALPEFAVLVPIVEHGGEDCILLTKRPDRLARYSGQVSFPGGARDPEDLDLSATALRETGEEVGIGPERISLLAELPWQSTTLGHRVKPYLARVAPGPISPNSEEVDKVLYLPLAVIRRDPFRVRGTWIDPAGLAHVTYTFQWEGLEVWGLTARILRDCFVPDGGPEGGTSGRG